MANPEIEVSANRQLSELVKQAASSNQIMTLAAHGQSKAVLLSLEAFEYLVEGQAYRQRQLLPLDEFHQQFHQALVEAGYDSREKIINLVQEVKQELAAERDQKSLPHPKLGGAGR